MAITLKQYMTAVEKKLNDSSVKRLLQFGQTYSKKTTKLRDAVGMEMTRRTIMQTAENAFNYMDGKVGLAHMIQNFSSTGYSDVSKVETVGAIDLTILAMSQSLIPFVCVDRGLSTPTSTIYFNNIVSKSNDGVGGVNKSEVVSGNFMPPNTKVDLGLKRAGGEAAEGAIMLGENLLPGTVKVTVTAGEEVFIGQDFSKDGVIYFNGGAITAKVNYATGAVTITGATSETVSAEATLDSTADDAGSNVLTVIPEWVPVTLETEPLNIILQNNIHNMMFMQKTYTTATGSTASPYNDVLFQRVKNTYLEAVNSMIIKKLIQSVAGVDPLKISLADYDVRAFASTKTDIVNQLISSMKATMLGRTGCPLTALIVNSNAAAIIEQIPIQFVANPMINMGLNGLIGYYNGIPVFRHNSLDVNHVGYTPGANGVIFGVFRNADNTSGSQVFGEFIPFTSTGNVSNFYMPTQNSTGYFSQVGSKVVQDSLVVQGIIELSAVGSGTANQMFVDFSKPVNN